MYNVPSLLGYETNMKMIAISYLTSLGFMLDIVAILPIEIAALAMSDHLLDWAITLKINRILKLWKVHIHVHVHMYSIFINYMFMYIYIHVIVLGSLQHILLLLHTYDTALMYVHLEITPNYSVWVCLHY